jgi:hypothetical protein
MTRAPQSFVSQRVGANTAHHRHRQSGSTKMTGDIKWRPAEE